jgi:hypothetical protein
VTDAIDELVAGTPERLLARWLMGSTDPAAIRGRLERFVRDRMGATVAECFLCTMSVGAVFGVTLGDGRRVVVKVLRPETDMPQARAQRRVQDACHAAGFPAPEPLLPPEQFGPSAIAVVDAFVPGGDVADGHDPAIRRTGARALARLVDLARAVTGTEALLVPAPQVPDDLWPTPHNPLFDFRATAAGAEWIDGLAREARGADDPVGEVVVLHTDWTMRNLRYLGADLHVVFDWDSVRRDLETRVVGTTAAMFPSPGRREGMAPPTPDEARAFVTEYEAARGAAFSDAERRVVGAATLFGMAYTARCEHAVDGAGAHRADSYRSMLAEHGPAYLDASS